MDIDLLKANAQALNRELEWLAAIIDARLKKYFGQDEDVPDIPDITPPSLQGDNSVYASVIRHYGMNFQERVILALAIAPHVKPHLLDVFFTRNSTYDRSFTEFGGIRGQHHGGFLPTGETASFILDGGDLVKRFELLAIFDEDHFFRKFRILDLVISQPNEPFLSGSISLTSEYLSYFTSGVSHKPDYSINFPAKRITTQLDWADLVLDENIMEEVGEIRDWIEHGDTLINEWGMKRKIKPGYRTLFYGPPGTGKTLTASLLGKSADMDVYRIDLSMVVSKYIGETEKNLANVFDQAENKNWILFFDEADALFGKRGQTSNANDRHANQEVSYLLQRIEDFPGVVILATNLKANLDDAFSRRFQSMIYFPMPGNIQRKRLWRQAFPDHAVLEDGFDIDEIANKHEMAGGAIINVSRYSAMKALKRGDNVIMKKDVVDGIRKEFGKDGKIV